MTKKNDGNNNLLLNFTDLNNSVYSFKRLINEKFKKDDRFAVCLLNINNFKYYNYRFSYEFGDTLLQIIFNKVREAIGDKGYICRFGGDTLLILLKEISNQNELIPIFNSITDIFSSLINIGGKTLKISVNMGISIYPDDSNDISDILKYAEIALDYSKKFCKDKFKFFDQIAFEKIVNKFDIEEDIINAIHCNEFILYYQPQVDAKTMRVYGAETLLRWNHPKRGVLSPSYFIEIIEQNDLINELGKFVFREACNQLIIWHKLGYKDLSISINISTKQLEENSFLSFIEHILKTTQIDAKYICFEITERMLINPTAKITNILSALRKKGIKIIIDDFGTKYSSLNYLYCFPIDGIKIDKSFIGNMHDNNKERIILKNVVNLAHEISLDVVAEGVETREQLRYMEKINCYNIQGYLFGQPVNAKEFENYLIQYNT